MIDEIANYIKDGDILSVTDIISVYISSSPKYKSQAEFAEAIGTNRQTLYRMLINENVGVHIFYRAIERIHQDAQE